MVGIIFGFFIFKKPIKNNQNDEKPNPDIKVAADSKIQNAIVPDSKNSINILLTGSGGVNHDGGNLTDSITLININYANRVIKLIAIPRDLWVSGQKINLVYSKDGRDQFKYLIGQVTGINVNYFINVDFGNLYINPTSTTGFKEHINMITGLYEGHIFINRFDAYIHNFSSPREAGYCIPVPRRRRSPPAPPPHPISAPSPEEEAPF